VQTSFGELQRVLDIKQLVTAAIVRMEAVMSDLEEKKSEIMLKGRGISQLFNMFPKIGRDVAELERLYTELQGAITKVEDTSKEVENHIGAVLAKLKDPLTKPQEIEALATTIQNGNINELYLTQFNLDLTELKIAVEALGRILNMSGMIEAQPDESKLLVEASESKEQQTYTEMKEIFGEDFFGFNEIEEAFALKNGLKLVDFHSTKKAEAMKMLFDFVHEPDVKQFLEKIKSGEIRKGGWQLCLEIPTFFDTISSIESPLTMLAMDQCLSPDMKDREQGELFYSFPNTMKVEEPSLVSDKFDERDFFVRDTMPMQWVLSTKGIVPVTLNKRYDEGLATLKKFADKNGLFFDSSQSDTHPLEVSYRFFVALRTTKKYNILRLFNVYKERSKMEEGAYIRMGKFDLLGGFLIMSNKSNFASKDSGLVYTRRSGESPDAFATQ